MRAQAAKRDVAVSIAVMAGTRPDEQIREVAYAEFLRSRGKYPRAASFLDADRRREFAHDETQLDELQRRQLADYIVSPSAVQPATATQPPLTV